MGSFTDALEGLASYKADFGNAREGMPGTRRGARLALAGLSEESIHQT